MPASDSRPIQYLQFGTHLLIYQARDRSWWYKELSAGDFSMSRPFAGLDERTAYGPFTRSEDAARDAADRLDLPMSAIVPGGPSMTAPESDAGRAEAALRDGILLRQSLAQDQGDLTIGGHE